MATIQIVGKNKGRTEVLDEAKNRTEAKSQVKYWKNIRPGWKIESKTK